jgi:acyl-CoA thioesterase
LTHSDPSDSISFDEALAIDGGERRYTAQVHPSWDGPLTTHGGLQAALALLAIDREIGAGGTKQVRSLTAHYLRPPQHGEIDIHVDPLRTGRRFSSARAVISQAGRPCIAVLATYSVRDLPDVTSWSIAMPEVAPAPTRDSPRVDPSEFRQGENNWVQMPDGAPQFFNQMLIAPRFGDPPFAGADPDPLTGTTNGGWILLPEPRAIDPAFMALLVDAFWPSVLQPLRVAAIAPTLELTIHFRRVFPPEGYPDQPLLVHNTSCAVIDGISDSDSRVFTADGTLLAQGRQAQLVAPFPT